MQRNRVQSTESNGGAIDRRTVGMSLMGVGLGAASVWNLSSTVHTLVAAPVASIATLGTATVASGSGAYLYIKQNQELNASVADA